MKFFIHITFLLSLFLMPLLSFAQVDCLDGENQEECRHRLLQNKQKLEEEVKRLEGNIQKENQNQQTLGTEITKLKNQIKKTSYAIGKKNSLISTLKKEISLKEKSLSQLNEKLKREKESLEQILRKRNEVGEATFLEVLLSKNRFSEFYQDLPEFSSVQLALSKSFTQIENIKKQIYGEKETLEKKKQQENNVRYSLSLEKGKIENQKKDRDNALNLSKTKEATLLELKKQREAEIKKIRSRLIQFQGNGVSRSISFGEAYDYAKQAEKHTGVRASFIMAIMQQESGFGNNVGGCYLTKKPEYPVGGSYKYDGVYIKSGKQSKKNMNPNQFAAFLRVTSALGRDWKKTPISCVMLSNGVMYGYGGAMGYTQFIPTTWEGVTSKIKKFLNISSYPNPWNPEHAVMATGVFMMNQGAFVGTYTAEYNAACRYFGSCSVYGYGSSVMSKAKILQKTIDILERD